MNVYSLTSEEIVTIQTLNQQRVNTLLIVCDFGDVAGVDPEALQRSEYADYLAALGEFNVERIVEVEVVDI